MKVVKLKSFQTFLKYVDTDMSQGDWGFRGVPDANFALVPSVGRPGARETYSFAMERMIFDRFCQMAVPYVASRPPDAITWLALARHHGLPTRLLDWTLSPLVAAYFASSVESEIKEDTHFAIYAFRSSYFGKTQPIKDPFVIKGSYQEVHSDHYSDRMAAQRGFFTIHSNPVEPFDHNSLVKMTFSCDRYTFLYDLDFYGINRASLFPGLDGIAGFWSWYYKIIEPS